MSKCKLVPVEPTAEMVSEGARHLQIMSLPEREAASVFRAMLAAAPTVEPVGFCEDTALSLAERTFSSEVDENLAEDIIQYARRLHDMYAAPRPTPDVAKLVEALEGLLKITDESLGVSGYHLNGNMAPWCEFGEVEMAEEALAPYRQQGGDFMIYDNQFEYDNATEPEPDVDVSEIIEAAADCPNKRLVMLQNTIQTLRDLPQVQCDDGNRTYDPYMHGTVDGMIFALSLLEAGESKYSDALAERLKDRLSPEKAGEASAT